MDRRALSVVAVSLLAVVIVVASLRGGGDGEASNVDPPSPRPPKPLVAPSGAVAIEGPMQDGGFRMVPLPAVAAMVAAVDAGVHVAPIDLTTGKPLEPARVLEGSAAHESIPVPRRVRDRGAIVN